MKLSKELTALLAQKHFLENGLSNLLEAETNDAFDVILCYKNKKSSMQELIVIYDNLLLYYYNNPEVLSEIVKSY